MSSLVAAARDSLVQPQFTGTQMPLHLDAAEPNHGLFWAQRRNGTLGHTGGDSGLIIFFFYDPATGVGKIFVTNTEVHNSPQSLAQFQAIWKSLDRVM